MHRSSVAVLLLVCSLAPTPTNAVALNPIRKVVTLLQQMQQKVTAEGEKEKELYDKFMCYCKNGASDLSSSISSADSKISSLSSDIEAAVAKKAKTDSDLKGHQVDRDEAIKTMAEATAIRENEAGVYSKAKADYGANAAAMDKAVKALEKGMAGAFLQSSAAGVLRQAVSNSGMEADDRQTLLSFLSGSADYAPQSGQITGILKTMQDEMHAGYTEATETEDAAIKGHRELIASKTKEKKLASAAIETKTEKSGELGISVAQMKNDKGDTEEAMAADQEFQAGLDKSCKTKTAEWEERSKVRSEELVALADTIKVLNDDDALEIFKKTLPSGSASASFVQVQVSKSAIRARALAAVRRSLVTADRGARPGLDLIALALRGQKVGFDKVVSMIDKMVKNLQVEQSDDDHKKEYCNGQFDTTDDKQKALERKVSDHETAMASAEESIATLKEEIAALLAGIKALDKSVAEATENRKEEHTEYNELMASNSAAKEVLGFAKNRLSKFYNPKMYKAPPKRELSKEDRIAVNMGGTPPPTEAPGGIAGTGITVLAQVSEHSQRKSLREAPAPPPETFGAYTTKSEENNGVMSMIDLLIKDLDKEMTVADTEEKDGQGDYETLMKDSAAKRTADSKSLSEKESAKADTEAALEKHTDDRDSTHKELQATLMYIQSLHGECDFIIKYHGTRKEARDSEIDSLGKAKSVLSGADYSLLQTRSRGFLRGSA